MPSPPQGSGLESQVLRSQRHGGFRIPPVTFKLSKPEVREYMALRMPGCPQEDHMTEPHRKTSRGLRYGGSSSSTAGLGPSLPRMPDRVFCAYLTGPGRGSDQSLGESRSWGLTLCPVSMPTVVSPDRTPGGILDLLGHHTSLGTHVSSHALGLCSQLSHKEGEWMA
jgi:hypothetical protein